MLGTGRSEHTGIEQGTRGILARFQPDRFESDILHQLLRDSVTATRGAHNAELWVQLPVSQPVMPC